MSLANTDIVAALPLQQLRIFWAAARHLNMVRAAAELSITQGAVSRQIKALETTLGEQLFRRTPRGLLLTEAGDLLSEYVARGFEELSSGLFRIGQPRLRTTLLVSAPHTFALRVLTARVGNFVQQFPWVDLRITGHRYYADPERAGVDLSIRLGTGQWRSGRTVPLSIHEPLFPVCAPSLLPAAMRHEQPAAQTALLRGKTLLHYAERPYWSNWLAAAGLAFNITNSGPSFNETAFALAAAEAGQGIAIGRHAQVADALRLGTLIRPFEAELVDGAGYYVVMAEAAAQKSTVQVFIRWLQAQCERLHHQQLPSSPRPARLAELPGDSGRAR